MCHKGNAHVPIPPPHLLLRARVLHPALPVCGPILGGRLPSPLSTPWGRLSSPHLMGGPGTLALDRSFPRGGSCLFICIVNSVRAETTRHQSLILNQPTPASYLAAEKEAACEHSRVGQPPPHRVPCSAPHPHRCREVTSLHLHFHQPPSATGRCPASGHIAFPSLRPLPIPPSRGSVGALGCLAAHYHSPPQPTALKH